MTDLVPENQRAEELTGPVLRLLSRRTPVTSGWRAPDTVRRTAVQRGRTRWSAGAGG